MISKLRQLLFVVTTVGIFLLVLTQASGCRNHTPTPTLTPALPGRPSPTPTSAPTVQWYFHYLIQVEAQGSDACVPGAEVTIRIGDRSFSQVTDGTCLARITVPSQYVDAPAILIVEAMGYRRHWRDISVTADEYQPPLLVQLERSSSATHTPTVGPNGTVTTGTPTATRTATSTPTPKPTDIPTRSSSALSPPTLVSPKNGMWVKNPVEFRWQGILLSGERFQVEATHCETGESYRSPTTGHRSCAGLLPRGSSHEWTWSVLVLQGAVELRRSAQGGFNFDPNFDSDPDSDDPDPDPCPSPTYHRTPRDD